MTVEPLARGFRLRLHPRLSNVFPPCGKHPKKSSPKESSPHQPNTDSGDSRSGTKPLPAKAQNARERVAKTALCCAPSAHMRRRAVARYMQPRQRRIRVGAKAPESVVSVKKACLSGVIRDWDLEPLRGMCAGYALHGITAGVGKAGTRGQAAPPPCAARRHACLPDAPAAQWNELHAFAVLL